jgi:hypothetical protein
VTHGNGVFVAVGFKLNYGPPTFVPVIFNSTNGIDWVGVHPPS